MSNHEIEYEYEQDEQDDVIVSLNVDLSWYAAEPDVGIFGAWCEVDDISIAIDGVNVPWNMASRTWVLANFPQIKDPDAFLKDMDKRVEAFTESAEPE